MIDSESNENRRKAILKVTFVGFMANMLLFAGKLFAGIVGRSSAMIADAVHSLSDFATDVIVMFFINISSKPRDESHDYGHGKYETLATALIGAALMFVAIGIGISGIKLIWHFIHGGDIEAPGAIAVVAALISIVCKESLYWYTVISGRRLQSAATMANAWHHRSDAISSIGTFLGIGAAYWLGDKWIVLDPVASVVVSLLIAKVSIDLMVPSLNELLEKSLPRDVEDDIMTIIMADSEVHDPHNLKTRRLGTDIAIEVHIRLDGDMSVATSHSKTVDIERRIREKYGQATMVAIHVEPIKKLS